MNILIIYTYPNYQSFNSAILKVVQQNLSKDHNVKTLDLYEEQFDPVLRFDDTHKRRDLSTVPDMEKISQFDYLGGPYHLYLSYLVV